MLKINRKLRVIIILIVSVIVLDKLLYKTEGVPRDLVTNFDKYEKVFSDVACFFDDKTENYGVGVTVKYFSYVVDSHFELTEADKEVFINLYKSIGIKNIMKKGPLIEFYIPNADASIYYSDLTPLEIEKYIFPNATAYEPLLYKEIKTNWGYIKFPFVPRKNFFDEL